MFWPVSNLNGVEKLSKEMHFSSGPLLGVIIPEMHPVPPVLPPPDASDEPHLSWVKSGARWGDEDEATRQSRMKWADCPAWILISICHPLVSALWWHGPHYAAHKPDHLLSSELSYWHFLTRGASSRSVGDWGSHAFENLGFRSAADAFEAFGLWWVGRG